MSTYREENGKVYNEAGQVGVVVSPGYGAGVYTWNEGCMTPFEPKIVMALLDGTTRTDKEWHSWGKANMDGEFYAGGLKQAVVEWLDSGARFYINEHDGNESLVEDDQRSHIA